MLQTELLTELEPSIHQIIKKQLGFSEPTLLSASLNCLQQGGNREELTRRLCTILDHKKASRLSDRICEAVDEFLLARDLPQINGSAVTKKRPQPPPDSEDLDGVPMTKKAKPGDQEPAAAPMTAAQIKAMMANAKQQLMERKAALATLRGNSGLGSNTAKVPLPPPQLLSSFDPPSAPAPTQTMDSIAALQARINKSMEKMVGPIAPPPSSMENLNAG